MIRKSQFIFFFLVFFLFIGLQPVSGYVWQDHFTADTSTNYLGTTGAADWSNIGLGTGWINISGTAVFHYSYIGEKFGGGSYTWIEQWNEYLYLNGWHYAAEEAYTTGQPYETGNKYYILTYHTAEYTYNIYLRKVVGGAQTNLATATGITVSPDIHNWTMVWDNTAGIHDFYLDNILIVQTTDDTFTNPGYMGTNHAINWGSGISGEDLWQYFNSTEEEPTPTPTPTPTSLPSEINPHVISKGKTFIYWGWNETGINYTYLDGILVNLNNGTYIYSNLVPNTKHILTLSYDGINETSSIVFTDKEYTYDIWLVPLIGLILIFGFKLSPISPFFGFLIILINLVTNLNQFNDVEKIVNILFIITGLLLFKFKFGDI